jgi:hypothetical protein
MVGLVVGPTTLDKGAGFDPCDPGSVPPMGRGRNLWSLSTGRPSEPAVEPPDDTDDINADSFVLDERRVVVLMAIAAWTPCPATAAPAIAH